MRYHPPTSVDPIVPPPSSPPIPFPPMLLLPQGLIPRGGELIKLGGSLFLVFLPFMLVFSLLFTGVYAVR